MHSARLVFTRGVDAVDAEGDQRQNRPAHVSSFALADVRRLDEALDVLKAEPSSCDRLFKHLKLRSRPLADVFVVRGCDNAGRKFGLL